MDAMMVEPARFLAKTFAAQGQPTYLYRFSYVAESLRAQTPGAPHATEIPFVFDTVKAKLRRQLTRERRGRRAKAANACWANFAKTGNPNGAELTTWPVYKAGDGYHPRLHEPGPEGRPGCVEGADGRDGSRRAGTLTGERGRTGEPRASGGKRGERGLAGRARALAQGEQGPSGASGA